MIISMEDLAGRVLAGSMSGRSTLARLVEHASHEPDQPGPTFLDFKNVDVATASFLRESVLAFRDAVRRRRSNIYPVVANANELVEEELRVLLSAQGDALMLCSLDEAGNPLHPRLVGDLDPKQRLTFDLVQQSGHTDAAQLMRDHGRSEQTTVQTAWNNRLSALANLGLVVEESRGRFKSYRRLFSQE